MATFSIVLKDVFQLRPEDFTEDKWIGLDDYPIWGKDDTDRAARRERLNQLIKWEYYNQEINGETIGMFSLMVRRKMHINMPLFNLLYKSAAQEFDALVTQNVTTTATREANVEGTTETDGEQTAATDGVANSTSTSSNKSESTSLSVASDFPQSMLSDRGNYASSSQDGDGTTNANGTAISNDSNNTTQTGTNKDKGKTTGKNTETAVNTVKGYTGSPADLIMLERASFINVDKMVIDMLATCFMGVWSDNAQHLSRRTY